MKLYGFAIALINGDKQGDLYHTDAARIRCTGISKEIDDYGNWNARQFTIEDNLSFSTDLNINQDSRTKIAAF